MSAPNAPPATKKEATADTRSIASTSENSADDDNKLLEIGYVPSFKREFSNIATVRTSSPPAFLTISDIPADQLRVQHHGSLLQYRNDLQYPSHSRGASVGDMVLDPGGDDVLHTWCVSFLSHALSPPPVKSSPRAYLSDTIASAVAEQACAEVTGQRWNSA